MGGGRVKGYGGGGRSAGDQGVGWWSLGVVEV